ncbi:hypothetical protein AGMMS49593_00860 [Endomicrobiia bacterium]|nr:hypothetical protein AGMMS49593_00860 [Endomicrobiia bacterium]GHT45239.1 hypothetical protein AGMMS49936_02160 [Endomicrobiia bacterium]
MAKSRHQVPFFDDGKLCNIKTPVEIKFKEEKNDKRSTSSYWKERTTINKRGSRFKNSCKRQICYAV